MIDITKANIILHVCDTAMHILHDSDLKLTDLWPGGGFKPIERNTIFVTDTIYYTVNAFGIELTPMTGRFVIGVRDYDEERKNKQFKAISLLLDHAYYNDLYFEDEFRDVTVSHDHHWFKYTYTPII